MTASAAAPSAPYADFYRRSIDEREAFWAEQAQLDDVVLEKAVELQASAA